MQSLNFKFKFHLVSMSSNWSNLKRKVLVKAENYAFFAFTYDDEFQTYEYAKFSFPTTVESTSLSQIEATFFDWRYHFQMEASSTTSDEKFLTHVILNKSNVFDCFFDNNVEKNVYGHVQFSPMYRYLESRMQNKNVQSNLLSRCLKNKLSTINAKIQQKRGLS